MDLLVQDNIIKIAKSKERMDTIFIGIDGGKDGAVAVKVSGSRILSLYDTPTYEVKKARNKIKREFDERGMFDILKPFAGIEGVCVILEAAHAMPKQGVTSMFSTGEGYGLWRGLLTGLSMSFEIVNAKKWQKVMGFIKSNPKGQSYKIASRLFPEAEFKGPRGGIKDGRCDAALIAECGEREASHSVYFKNKNKNKGEDDQS